MLKIFTNKEAQDLHYAEENRSILRINELQKEEKRLRSLIADSDKEFREMLSRNQSIWEEEYSNHADWVKKKETEIKILEERRNKSLIPIGELKKTTELELEKALNLQKEAENKELKMEEISSLLQEKLTEIGQKETDLKIKEEKLEARDLSLSFHEKELENTSKSLDKVISEENIKLEKYRKEIEAEKIKIILEKNSIESIKNLLNQKEEEIREKEIQLEDQRLTLQRAFERLKNK